MIVMLKLANGFSDYEQVPRREDRSLLPWATAAVEMSQMTPLTPGYPIITFVKLTSGKTLQLHNERLEIKIKSG